MLWQQYVFRSNDAVCEMWEQMFDRKDGVRLLYIAGPGFDGSTGHALATLLECLHSCATVIESAELLLIEQGDYSLSPELLERRRDNAQSLTATFSSIGTTTTVEIGKAATGEEDLTATTRLRDGVQAILGHIVELTDVVLDVSSISRALYLAILTAILDRLVSNRKDAQSLAGSINFHVVMAEDHSVNKMVLAEDLREELVGIPGYAGAFPESSQQWPVVWFPMLGEGRVNQFDKVHRTLIPSTAEICPVLPHPSRDLRRADKLLVEYRESLFEQRETPTSNIMYVNEANPFEVYRQMLGVMQRYRLSLSILGGCTLVVTPLSSKLMSLGAGLACFEMRHSDDDNYRVALPYAEPTRYTLQAGPFERPQRGLHVLLLTGAPYRLD